jgi:signal transduction histidine kinase
VTESLFEELKRYVRFGTEDEQALRELRPLLSPDFVAIIDLFYARIEEHPQASAVIVGGAAQVTRLKQTLNAWLAHFFTGPWDEAYFEHRCAIGRRHVLIGLPQHYNFTAMGLIRTELQRRVLARTSDPELAARRSVAIDKLIDLELAIILHTYREDYTSQLRRHERLATFGQMTSTIAHELRNPLGVIQSSVYLLRRRIGEDDGAIRHADKIQAHVARANRIITNLLDIVRERPPVRTPVEPSTLAAAAAQMTQETRGVSVEVHVAPDLPKVAVDPDQFQQVLRNLIDNAIDAAGTGGTVRMDVALRGQEVEIVVSDSGPGIDPALKERLFEPLVTSKHSGVGLGLALCRKLVAAHEGVIELVPPRVLSGAHFAVRLRALP